jgi:nitroreductase
MVIVGIATPKSHPKVPEVEQLMSAAAGMSFLGLALRDAGYGVMWRTGGVAYHPEVLDGLGLEPGESVVGFLYTGKVSANKPPVPRPDTGDFVKVWRGPGCQESW